MVNDTSESQYNRPPSYALSERQRAYLASGETGSYRESKLEGDIQEKVDNLGHRLDHLLSDIRLLYRSGYLDEDHWGDAWLSLVGFDQWKHTPASTFRLVDGFADTDDEPTSRDVVDAFTLGDNPSRGDRPTTAPTELARDVGSSLYQLTIVPDEGLNRERVLAEMAWGLVKGFYIENRLAAEIYENDPEDTPMAELLDYFDARRDLDIEYNNDSREMRAKRKESKENWDSVENDIHRRIRDICRAEGLPIVEGPERYKPDTTVESVSAYEVYHALIDRLVADVEAPERFGEDGGKVMGSMGQLILFQQEYGPADELDPEELVTREEVLKIVSKYNLVTKAKLEPIIVDDGERLEETSWKTIEATDITDLLKESETALSSTKIAKELKTESHTGTVTKLCRDLAGREFERPLLEGDSGGWELTRYGRFVAGSAGHSYGIADVTGPSGDPEGRAEVIAEVGEAVGIDGWEFRQES